MRRADFETMVRHMAAEVPPEFLEGIAEIVVSPRSVPHPTRGEIYTLGECIPLPTGSGDGAGHGVQSRVVLFHGSFVALARLDPEFDWRGEAWETLTHELRHHVEWRAHAPTLDAYDRAVEHNFARHDGERFDPLFFLDGDSPVPGVFEVDGDYFLDRVVRNLPAEAELEWHGRRYRGPVPPDAELPAFLTVEGVEEPPPGELLLVLRRKPRLLDLFRATEPFHGTLRVSTLYSNP